MAKGAEDGPAAADPGFDPAHRQFGSYVLGRQIGAGGMGVVYEARRLADEGKVAVKLIREFHVASPTLLRRFTIEAEAAARLDHPHIVRIHEVGEWDGQPFFSMDFIEGESLNAQIARGHFAFGHVPAGTGGIPPPQAEIAFHASRITHHADIARLMAKVARAVHHAHGRGVLHRDLKPGNILIDHQGEPHLTDFGLAKILQHDLEEAGAPTLTASGDVPGTPSYMSPEQVSGADIGVAADIYGLGAVLYALLTGRPPFQGPTPLEVFKQIVDILPARPRSLNPTVHPDLETICLKCLEKDPRHRYGTAEALAGDLEKFAAGRPIVARPAGPVHRTRQWIKRNPVGAALIACLCLGLSMALGLLKVVNDQRRAMELDRDEAFDEGMQRISQIWREPATKAVTISARELAILAGRSPAGLARAKHQLSLGVNANDRPSSVAQRYARLLGSFQEHLERDLGEKVAFHLRLLKRFSQKEETLAGGEVDFIVLGAVEFLRAEKAAPGVTPIARANTSREAVIFTRADSGIQRLADLRGKSVAFPDPDLSLTVWAKARLVEAGLRARDLRFSTNIVDQGAEAGQTVISVAATIDRVLRGEAEAGVTRRSQFEHYRHLGLVVLDQFPETPSVLAARAGLDPKLVEALRNVVRSHEDSRSWPDSRFVLDAPADKGSLDALRRAMQQAERFEERTAAQGAMTKE